MLVINWIVFIALAIWVINLKVKLTRAKSAIRKSQSNLVREHLEKQIEQIDLLFCRITYSFYAVCVFYIAGIIIAWNPYWINSVPTMNQKTRFLLLLVLACIVATFIIIGNITYKERNR